MKQSCCSKTGHVSMMTSSQARPHMFSASHASVNLHSELSAAAAGAGALIIAA